MLLDLPLEILHLILDHLDPYSLSSLSRSHPLLQELTRESDIRHDIV